METENDTQTTERLAAQALEVRFVDGNPFVVTPQGCSVVDMEKYLKLPLRIRRKESFVALESFTRYVNVHKDDSSQVHLDRDGNAEAILDGVMDAIPSWESHRARFTITFSQRWQVWRNLNKAIFTQKKFAEFIEDNNRDFFAPKAAAMLDIARTMEAEQNASFKSAIKDSNNDVKFNFERNTVAKAGQRGELEIPSRFTISIPVLEGETPRLIEVRLRYELENEKLVLSYDILNLAQLQDEVKQSVYAIINNDTGLTPFLVASLETSR